MSSNGNGKGLTVKQKMFVEAYLTNGFNATDAARHAGYAHPNKSGPANMVKVGIREIINASLDAATMTAEEALARENDIANFDVSKYLNNPEGRLTGLDLRKLIDDGVGHLVRGVKHSAHGTTIEWADPDSARDRILKARGAYHHKQEIEHSGEVHHVVNWDDPNDE